jgi:hypothetical protein
MEEGGYVLLDEFFQKIVTETTVMWENLACVGEINYSSTSFFSEGVASIITRSDFKIIYHFAN